jgi:hypothetical protein
MTDPDSEPAREGETSRIETNPLDFEKIKMTNHRDAEAQRKNQKKISEVG